jgi:ribonuclease BN (tRNA processing enzyme)
MAKLHQVSLTNDGSLELLFVGSGSAFTKKFYQTNLLVVKGDDHLLIDCGSRGPEALSALGLTVTKVENYLITHSHADHIGGLEEVMLLNRYVTRKKPTIIVKREFGQILWDSSLKGGAAYNEVSSGKYLSFEDLWNIVEPVPDPWGYREYATVNVGSIKIGIFRTNHIPDCAPTWKEAFYSYGVVIDDKILFTSDTKFDPELLDTMDAKFDFHTIFHDCQLYKGGVHASLEELSSLKPSMKKRMHLVHYQDSVDKAEDSAREAGFAGFVRQWKIYRF